MGRRSAFLPPVKTKPINPYMQGVTYKQLEQQYKKEMAQATNNTFNLIISACLIASKDMGHSQNETLELSKRIFGVLDDVADDLATVDGMMEMVKEMGIPVYEESESKSEKQRETMLKKTTVFELLEKGIDEIEDILKIANKHGIEMNYREACNYRWAFNKIKYWEDGQMATNKMHEVMQMLKDGIKAEEIMQQVDITNSTFNTYKSYFNQMYTEDGEMTDKMRECWDGFKEGMTVPEVIKATGYGKMFVFNAYNEYQLFKEIQAKKSGQIAEGESTKEIIGNEPLTTEQFTEEFFKDIESKEEPPEKEVPPEKEEPSEEVSAVEDEEIKSEPIEQAVEVIKGDKQMENSKARFNRVVKVVELQGEYATYKPRDNGEIEVSTEGCHITLRKEGILEFAEELIAAVNELE